VKRLFATILLAVGLLAPLSLSTHVYAQSFSENKKEACAGLKVTGASCSDGNDDVNNVVKNALNILSFVIGIAAVIMIIIAGLRYVTSNGEAQAISGAKNTIIYALIGVVVALLAQALVRFVLTRTATPVTRIGSSSVVV
jgi:Type IV secretion system pilin